MCGQECAVHAKTAKLWMCIWGEGREASLQTCLTSERPRGPVHAPFYDESAKVKLTGMESVRCSYLFKSVSAVCALAYQ
jgi:hypothetical protein